VRRDLQRRMMDDVRDNNGSSGMGSPAGFGDASLASGSVSNPMSVRLGRDSVDGGSSLAADDLASAAGPLSAMDIVRPAPLPPVIHLSRGHLTG